MNMPEERQCRGSKESTGGGNESPGWEVAGEWKQRRLFSGKETPTATAAGEKSEWYKPERGGEAGY